MRPTSNTISLKPLSLNLVTDQKVTTTNLDTKQSIPSPQTNKSIAILTKLSKRELFTKVYKETFERELLYLWDVANERATAKDGFTKKLVSLLTNVASSIPVVGDALDKLGQVAEFALNEHISGKIQCVAKLANHIDLPRLRVLLEVVALEAYRRYEWYIINRLTDNIEEGLIPFAELGAARSLEYLIRRHSGSGKDSQITLNEATLLAGLIEGRSGSFVQGWRNNKVKLQRKKESFFGNQYDAEDEIEDVYARSAMQYLEVNNSKVVRHYYMRKDARHMQVSRFQKFKDIFGDSTTWYDFGRVKTRDTKGFENDPRCGFAVMPLKIIRDRYDFEEKKQEYFSTSLLGELKLQNLTMIPIDTKTLQKYADWYRARNDKNYKSRVADYLKSEGKLGERIWRGADWVICQGDLSDLNLQGLNLSYMDLSGAILGGDLTGTSFEKSFLVGAHFLKNTSAKNSNFRQAFAPFMQAEGVDFSGSDLTQANFSFAKLNEATLEKCHIFGVNWYNAELVKVKDDVDVLKQQQEKQKAFEKEMEQERKSIVDIQKQLEEQKNVLQELEKNFGKSLESIKKKDNQEKNESFVKLKEIVSNLLDKQVHNDSFENICRVEINAMQKELKQLAAEQDIQKTMEKKYITDLQILKATLAKTADVQKAQELKIEFQKCEAKTNHILNEQAALKAYTEQLEKELHKNQQALTEIKDRQIFSLEIEINQLKIEVNQLQSDARQELSNLTEQLEGRLFKIVSEQNKRFIALEEQLKKTHQQVNECFLNLAANQESDRQAIQKINGELGDQRIALQRIEQEFSHNLHIAQEKQRQEQIEATSQLVNKLQHELKESEHKNQKETETLEVFFKQQLQCLKIGSQEALELVLATLKNEITQKLTAVEKSVKSNLIAIEEQLSTQEKNIQQDKIHWNTLEKTLAQIAEKQQDRDAIETEYRRDLEKTKQRLSRLEDAQTVQKHLTDVCEKRLEEIQQVLGKEIDRQATAKLEAERQEVKRLWSQSTKEYTALKTSIEELEAELQKNHQGLKALQTEQFKAIHLEMEQLKSGLNGLSQLQDSLKKELLASTNKLEETIAKTTTQQEKRLSALEESIKKSQADIEKVLRKEVDDINRQLIEQKREIQILKNQDNILEKEKARLVNLEKTITQILEEQKKHDELERKCITDLNAVQQRLQEITNNEIEQKRFQEECEQRLKVLNEALKEKVDIKKTSELQTEIQLIYEQMKQQTEAQTLFKNETKKIEQKLASEIQITQLELKNSVNDFKKKLLELNELHDAKLKKTVNKLLTDQEKRLASLENLFKENQREVNVQMKDLDSRTIHLESAMKDIENVVRKTNDILSVLTAEHKEIKNDLKNLHDFMTKQEQELQTIKINSNHQESKKEESISNFTIAARQAVLKTATAILGKTLKMTTSQAQKVAEQINKKGSLEDIYGCFCGKNQVPRIVRVYQAWVQGNKENTEALKTIFYLDPGSAHDMRIRMNNFAGLIEQLKNENTQLTVIDFYGLELTDTEAKTFVECLKNSKLEAINLAGSEISSNDKKQLAQSVAESEKTHQRRITIEGINNFNQLLEAARNQIKSSTVQTLFSGTNSVQTNMSSSSLSSTTHTSQLKY